MAQSILGTHLGHLAPIASNGTTTQALSAAGTWFAMSFIGNGKQISTIALYMSATAGSLTGSDVTLDIYSTGTTGDPNASVSGPHNCNETPSGAGWYTWTPTYTTTDGVMYWVVIKNVDGTPGTNYPTFRFLAAGCIPNGSGGPSGFWGWNKNHTTDSGGTWTNESRTVGGMMLSFSDSTHEGTPYSNLATSASTIFAAREAGVKFTLPANVSIGLRGVVLMFNTNTGTPTNALRARIYTGSSTTPTLLATSSGGPVAGMLAASSLFYFPFASVQTIAGGTTLRIVAGTTGADTSSNAYRTYEYTIRDTAAAKALTPFGGCAFTYSTDGTTFTDTDTLMAGFGLHLDNSAEWSASGGGSGIPGNLLGGLFQ